jgi:hypothetical protein
MSPNLDKQLCDKYPKIFIERNMPMSKSAMAYGFPDDGWYYLIDMLCFSIQSYIDDPYVTPPISQVVAIQVKEKWGGLKFYIKGGDSNIRNMIQMSENMSFRICEICGTSSTKRDIQTIPYIRQGIKTTCHECRNVEYVKNNL